MPARRMVFSLVQHPIQLLAHGIKETEGSIPGTDPVRWVQNEQTCRLGTCRPAVVSGSVSRLASLHKDRLAACCNFHGSIIGVK